MHLIDECHPALMELCRQYHVRRLELFGSGRTDERFDSTRSDVDFLVEFFPLEPGERADTYFGLLEALEALFHRPIDLVMTQAIKNPYFLEAINKEREQIYAA